MIFFSAEPERGYFSLLGHVSLFAKQGRLLFVMSFDIAGSAGHVEPQAGLGQWRPIIPLRACNPNNAWVEPRLLLEKSPTAKRHPANAVSRGVNSGHMQHHYVYDGIHSIPATPGLRAPSTTSTWCCSCNSAFCVVVTSTLLMVVLFLVTWYLVYSDRLAVHVDVRWIRDN